MRHTCTVLSKNNTSRSAHDITVQWYDPPAESTGRIDRARAYTCGAAFPVRRPAPIRSSSAPFPTLRRSACSHPRRAGISSSTVDCRVQLQLHVSSGVHRTHTSASAVGCTGSPCDGQIHFFSPSLSPLPKSILPKYLNRIELPLAKSRPKQPDRRIHGRRRHLGSSDVRSATHGRWARVAEGRRLVGRGVLCLCWVRRWSLSGSQPWFDAFLFDLFIY